LNLVESGNEPGKILFTQTEQINEMNATKRIGLEQNEITATKAEKLFNIDDTRVPVSRSSKPRAFQIANTQDFTDHSE
jgi:hypothetical protein